MRTDWQRHVLASSGYLELGMFDDAALALEEIEPEDKTRTEVLGARIALYITAKKWDMAAAVASHLVKIEPQNEAWWINLAYAKRRCEGIESAEAILLRARELHHDNAVIEFNLACYASVDAASKKQRNGSNAPSNWTSSFKRSLLMTRTCGPCGIGLLTWRRLSILLEQLPSCFRQALR